MSELVQFLILEPINGLILLAGLAIKGSLLLFVAFAAHHILGHSSAAHRYWAGLSVIAALLVLPLMMAVLPSLEVPLFSEPPRSIEPNPAPPGALGESTPAALVSAVGSWLARNWPRVAVAVWITGIFFFLARLIVAMMSVSRLSRRSSDPLASDWQVLVVRLSRRLGIRRPVRLLFSDRLEVALTVGLWRPAVILPAAARTWSPDRMEAILLHELAHVGRWDNLFNVLIHIACAIYWFNPLVWRTAGRLVVDRERACDDSVLKAGTRPSEYAGHLLKVAEALHPSRRLLGRPLEVSQSSALKDRLLAILDPRRKRHALGSTGPAATVLLTALVAPLAAFQPWADPDLRLGRDDRATGGGKRAGDVSPPASDPLQRPAPRSRGVRAARFVVQPSVRSAGRATLSAGSFSIAQRRPDPGAETWAGVSPALEDSYFGGRVEPTGLPLAGSVFGLVSSGSRPLQRTEPVLDRPDPIDRTPTERRLPDEPEEEKRPGGDESDQPVPDGPLNLVRIDLGTLGGGYSEATAINGRGEVAGTSTTEEGRILPFYWSRETGMLDMGTLGGSSDENCGLVCLDSGAHRAHDINELGQVVGTSRTRDGEIHGYLWSLEKGMVDVGTLGGPWSAAVAINESGLVIGTSVSADGIERAFAWTLQGGMVDLGGPEHLASQAVAVNQAGFVVGDIHGHAFIWSRDAGMHRIAPDDIYSKATGINSDGRVSGLAAFDRGFVRAFVWDAGEPIVDLGTLGKDFQASKALAVNEKGLVVGVSSAIRNVFVGDVEVRAFLWDQAVGMVDIEAVQEPKSRFTPALALNNRSLVIGQRPHRRASESIQGFAWVRDRGAVQLSDPENIFDLSWPSQVNDSGQIAGSASALVGGSQRSGGVHAFLWQPSGLSFSPDIRDRIDGPRPDSNTTSFEAHSRQSEQ